MIVRAHRFHGYNALRAVYSHGLTVRGPLTAIKYLANSRRGPGPSYRAAIVVSRKVHKSAVVRNRIRRRLYEIIRQVEPAMTGPYDIVVTAFSDQLATLASKELYSQLTAQLTRAGIIASISSDVTPGGHAIVDTKKGV